MKVKNLLLAGLAVAAMTACSNENDEIVNNGNQNPETAFMPVSYTHLDVYKRQANLNAGAMEIQKGGDLTTAKKHLAKADQKAPETLNNLGVIALLEGDYDAAEKYFNAAKAGGLTTQADTNMKQLKSIRNYPKE